MGKKSSVEKLNIALIDKAVEYMDSNKFRPLGGAYIDYTQKLNTEENRTNRQQEIQRISEILLNTTLNKRFHSPLILGAQVNRMVYSLATLTADKMREGGDIEQDANLILGIWDIQQSQQEQILLLLEEYEKKKLKHIAESDDDKLSKVDEAISNLEEKLKETKNHDSETKTLKILKSRNGSKCQADLQSYSSEFLLQEKPEINTGDETFE
jgi:replicative DNA helicase